MPRYQMLIVIAASLMWPSAASAETWNALLSDLLGYLNMDRAHLRQQLHAGEIIYAGMPEHEELPEQLAVGGTLMLLQQQPAEHVVRAFVDVEQMVQHAGSEILGLFSADDPSPFADVGLPPAELRALGSGAAAAQFNISATEAKRIRTGTPITTETYRSLLQGRFQRYYNQGLPGLEPYKRPQRTDDPARELQTALDGFQFLDNHFPAFYNAILGAPAAHEQSAEQLFVLHETESNGRTLHVLSRQLFEINDAWGLGADLQFYATHGLNAGFVLMGVVPYQQGSLVFALFHLFTNEVLGFGSTLKKRIGRGRATEILTAYFHTVRRQLETEKPAAAAPATR